MFTNRFNGEPDLIEFWHKDGPYIEVCWNPFFNESRDQLKGYVNQKETPALLGSIKETH